MKTYTTSQAAKVLNISASSVRNYCANPELVPFLSASAAPGGAKARQLTADDLRVLRHVSTATKAGSTLSEAITSLRAGVVETADDWQPEAELEPVPAQLALTIIGQQREIERQLHEQLTAAEKRISELETELTFRRLHWWQRLFR